jgi:hypothetical protein
MAKVVCKAALRAGPEMLVDFIPGGNIAKGFIDVAVDLVQEIYNANDSANIMQELSKIPGANNSDEYSNGLHKSLREFAANCTPDEQKLLQLPQTQILFVKFIDMFAAMPKHCRRQNARKDDPYGTTLRQDFNLNSSDDLSRQFRNIIMGWNSMVDGYSIAHWVKAVLAKFGKRIMWMRQQRQWRLKSVPISGEE